MHFKIVETLLIYAHDVERKSLYRVSYNIGSTLFFCYFVGFYSTKIQKLGEYKKIQEIFYKISTENLKLDLELAEIIDVKDGTRHLEIDILLLLRHKKK